LNSLTSSYARTNSTNTFNGNQTVSGSLTVTQDFIVLGSSSIQNVSSSTLNIGTNIITVAVNQPSVRFGGLSVIDSGSAGGSGSFLYDSVEDEFIFLHKGDGTNVTSSHFVLGPETYNNLGNETYLTNNRIPKGTGKEHLNDSNITDTGTLITLGSNTVVNGTLLATGTSLVSSSAQVVGILSSLNTYTGSNDTTNTAQNTRLTSIESVTGSYETKGSGIVSGSSQILPLLPTGTVSGSSQINVMSTTNIARLATTGSNVFNGNQVVTGSLTTTSNVSVGGVITLPGSIHTSAQINFRNVGSESELFKFPASNNTITKYGATDKLYYKTDKAVSNQNIFAMTTDGNVGFGLISPQSQVHLNGTLTFTEPSFDTVRRHTITHGHSDGSSVNNYVAINVSDGSGTTAERIRVNGSGQLLPAANGTQDLGSTSLRWGTIYTSDLSLNNGIGDWTIVEGEDDLFLYNNKKGKVYKFALTEVDPNVATPKKS